MHKSLLHACASPHSGPSVRSFLVIHSSSEFSVLPQAVISLVFKLAQDQQLLAGGRAEGETQLQYNGIYHFSFSSFCPRGCWHPPWAASLYYKLSWSPLTVTDLFPAYTGISAQLQGKNLNFNKIPTKLLIAVGIILWFLWVHTLIPSGKRFYLPQIKMKADRQPSNQSTSQKMSDYSRKQHLTA